MMSVTSALPREQATARILELTGPPVATGHSPWLVVTAGLPASGKSTFCRKLARATGAVILESDALRTALFGTPTHGKGESKLLFEALYAAADHLLNAGASVIIDATNLREQDRRRAYNVAEATGADVLVLHFHAPECVSAERLARRKDRGDPEDRSSAGLAVYRRLADTEEPITRDHWKIDTSDAIATDAALLHAIEKIKPPRGAAEGQDTGGNIS